MAEKGTSRRTQAVRPIVIQRGPSCKRSWTNGHCFVRLLPGNIRISLSLELQLCAPLHNSADEVKPWDKFWNNDNRLRICQPAHWSLIFNISRGFEKRTFEKPAHAPAITSPFVWSSCLCQEGFAKTHQGQTHVHGQKLSACLWWSRWWPAWWLSLKKWGIVDESITFWELSPVAT